ncbi:MAG TPA: class I SAM-dependent methyltransferase [Vicinamibacterales bacterium]|jgi:SAM-dependent methyltransferase|nr:class I SAM-dependent methyltransferase [Vicinamibacterales bacterium]
MPPPSRFARGAIEQFVKRRFRRWLGPIREYRAFRRRRSPRRLDIRVPGGAIEAIEIGSGGLLTVEGWSADLAAFEQALRLQCDGEARPPANVFRVPRTDLRAAHASSVFPGAVAEWALDPRASAATAVLLVGGREALTLTLPPMTAPPYGILHTHSTILKRQDVYCVGAPVPEVSDEILALARQLPAPILDFGCGAGALVCALRREGIEAYGLELDGDRITGHLLEAARPFVTLYSGALPAPFATGQFASVACSEVLEHLPDPDAALIEMARLARRRLLITVPDMSAVPRGFAHGVVPWHLLEASHVNFFTQHSLAAALAPHAASVEFLRCGIVGCDRLAFYSTLAAVATLAHA